MNLGTKDKPVRLTAKKLMVLLTQLNKCLPRERPMCFQHPRRKAAGSINHPDWNLQVFACRECCKTYNQTQIKEGAP